jgi:hypothetical protein
MTILIELSTELLLHVASFLPQVDLLNLSLTNKQLRNSTEPELFREYTNSQLYGRSCKPFLRRIIENPKLARHVHCLDLKSWSNLTEINPMFGHHDDPTLPPEEYGYFTKAARSARLISTVRQYDFNNTIVVRSNAMVSDPYDFSETVPGWYHYLYDPETHFDNVPFDNKFCQLLQAGIEDPLFILLLALLPNIQEILFRGGPHGGQHLNLLPSLSPEHRFSNLRKLTIAATDGELEWPLSSFSYQLQSQNLHTLECYLASEWDKDDASDFDWELRPPLIPVEPRSLNLTRLMLQYCAFSAPGIKTLLRACRSLKSFYYSAGGTRVGPLNFTCPNLVDALLPHRASLEILKLDMTTEWDYHEDQNWLSSLTEFAALQTLEVTSELENPQDFHLTVSDFTRKEPCNKLSNLLPDSLRILKFEQASQENALEQIEEMVAFKPNKFPDLEKITMVMDDRDYKGWAKDHKARLAKMIRSCKNAGVELAITTVEASLERTFFEHWVTEQKWQDVHFKDGMYVKEDKRPRTTEELVRDRILPEGIPQGMAPLH